MGGGGGGGGTTSHKQLMQKKNVGFDQLKIANTGLKLSHSLPKYVQNGQN